MKEIKEYVNSGKLLRDILENDSWYDKYHHFPHINCTKNYEFDVYDFQRMHHIMDYYHKVMEKKYNVKEYEYMPVDYLTMDLAADAYRYVYNEAYHVEDDEEFQNTFRDYLLRKISLDEYRKIRIKFFKK